MIQPSVFDEEEKYEAALISAVEKLENANNVSCLLIEFCVMSQAQYYVNMFYFLKYFLNILKSMSILNVK